MSRVTSEIKQCFCFCCPSFDCCFARLCHLYSSSSVRSSHTSYFDHSATILHCLCVSKPLALLRPFSFSMIGIGSLTCATSFVLTVHTKARQTLVCSHNVGSEELKNVLQPAASRNQVLTSGFTVQCIHQPATKSHPICRPC